MGFTETNYFLHLRMIKYGTEKIKDLWWKFHWSAATLKLLTGDVCNTRQFQCGWIRHRCGTSAKTHPSKHPIRSPSPSSTLVFSRRNMTEGPNTWPQNALNPNRAERYALNYGRPTLPFGPRGGPASDAPVVRQRLGVAPDWHKLALKT